MVLKTNGETRMPHELATTRGQVAHAYVGETPWHGLGQRLERGASIADWVTAAGLDYELGSMPVVVDDIEMPGRRLIYRTDSRTGMSIVSDNYHLVQPRQVVEFFKDWTNGIAEIETAGALFGGRRYWALARLEGELDLDGDVTRPYLLLASSCDGSSQTQAIPTSVRVVCNNTIRIAMQDSSIASVRHTSVFEPSQLREQVETLHGGIRSHFATLEALARIRVSDDQASQFLARALGTVDAGEPAHNRRSDRVFDLYRSGAAIGGEASTMMGTAYGILQAVTQYADHESGREQDNRLANAWFGKMSNRKMEIMDGLLALAA